MGGSNSRAENNAHIQSMANISNTRQRNLQDHELAMGRQALERQRQQLQAKTKEHEFKTELEIAHDSNSTSRHNTVVQASTDRFGSGMHVVASLGRAIIEGAFQLVGDMYKNRNQKERTQLEESGQTDRMLVYKNTVEIQVEGQKQIAKIQKDCAIELQKSAERVQKNNNNSNLKALNMEIDFKNAIDNGAKHRQITSQQSSSSSSSQSLPMQNQNVFGTSNSTNNFQLAQNQQVPNNADYHSIRQSLLANNFIDPSIPPFYSYSGIASSSPSSSVIMNDNFTPAPVHQTSAAVSVLPGNSASIEQYGRLMYNPAQNVNALRDPNVQSHSQVPHSVLQHHLPTQQSSVQNFVYYPDPSQSYFNPN